MILQAKPFLQDHAIHGESIWWNEMEHKLLWLDCMAKKLFLFNPESERLEEVALPKKFMAVIPAKSSGYVSVAERCVYLMDTHFQIKSFLYQLPEEKKDFRFNDCKCGPDGDLYLGVMSTKQKYTKGFLLRLSTNGEIHEVLSGVGISNGILWTKDETIMYYTDSIHGEIYAYDFKKGQVSNKRVIFQKKDTLPDGMCLDCQGNIWVALWGNYKVVCINPLTGEIVHEVALNVPQPSSVAIGGDVLYITTSALDLNKHEFQRYPNSGKLHKAKIGINGQQMYLSKY